MPGHGADSPLPQERELAYTAEVEAATAHLYERVRDVVPAVEWPLYAPFVYAINRLKAERGAVILAHNYMTPEIFACVGDLRGDSLQLAREAARTDAPLIVQAGVHFMAETSKILCPDKTVLIPDLRAGCSLAASITGRDVRLMRAAHPGVPVVTYVNSSAEVKAESDICCTSSNAVQVAEWAAAEWGTDRVIVIPDEFLARNVASQTSLRIITWQGRCEVHERFTAADIAALRQSFPGARVLAHPECPPDVLAVADYAGSTAALADWVGEHAPAKVILLTECSMSDNVALANPGTDFVRPCNLCPHMKRITLENIYDSLRELRYRVEVPADVAARARVAIERMLALPRIDRPPGFATGRPPAEVLVVPRA
ncbi:MAG: quinolinate synthase NadA [Gammaproteobacteria bacterium]|nr:quinolinate synthase NadA [Gammaproteobacteria bacterium]